MVWLVGMSRRKAPELHVIIAGCGRVGAYLARTLDGQGHGVAVIDKAPEAFRRLGDGFSGQTLAGIVFDRTTLEEAGIRKAQALVAVTNGDNSNIVSARTARERYGVEHVVARIYDPERAVIYERFGITAIASSRWTAEAVLRSLLPAGQRIEADLGPVPGEVVLSTLALPAGVHGLDAAVLNRPGESVLVGVTRGTLTRLPGPGDIVEAGDHVHLAISRPAFDRVCAWVAELGKVES